jgi:hypothetical protein
MQGGLGQRAFLDPAACEVMDPALVAAYMQAADQNQQYACLEARAWASPSYGTDLQEPAWLQHVPQRGVLSLPANAPPSPVYVHSSTPNYPNGMLPMAVSASDGSTLA